MKPSYRNKGTGFYAPPLKYENGLLTSSCLSVRLLVRMEQLGSHWTNSHEIRYLINSSNSVKKTEISFIKMGLEQRKFYAKTNTHFFIISGSFFLRMRNVPDKSCGENRNIYFRG